MVNSNNITDTSSRLLANLNNLSQKVYDGQNVGEQISDAVEKSMITTGNVLKYYPSLNKSMVRLDNSNRTVICKNISIIGGDMLCLFTPVGDPTFCEELKEPCVVPRGKLSAIITPLRDSKEWLLLGYFNRNDLVGFNPSKQGNLKLLAFGSLGEYSIKFGIDGLKIYNNGKVEKSEVDYLGEDVGDKFYTVEEVDEKLIETTDLFDGKILETKDNLESEIGDTKEDTISFLFDKIYPVGSIYMSVNPTSPSVLFGGEWAQLTDTFLYASNTADTDSTTSTGGSKDAVVVSHNHTQKSHNHTQDSHSHGTGNSTYNKFMATNKNIEISNNRKNTVNGSDGYIVFTDESGGEIAEYTATGGTTAKNQATTAENNATGESGTNKNMPPYMKVFMWKRIE